MPIYEFRCSECQHVFELLELKKEDRMEAKCPRCGSKSFKRVLSCTNYTASGSRSGAGSGGPTVNNRSCDGGSCTTIDIPGPSR